MHRIHLVAAAVAGAILLVASPARAESSATTELDLAYVHKAAHRYHEAADYFARARAVGANAQLVDLELGYIAAAQGYIAKARAHFIEATRGPDKELTERAVRELDVLTPERIVEAPPDTPPPPPPPVAPVRDENAATRALGEAYRAKAEGRFAAAAFAFQRARVTGADPQLVSMELGYLALATGDVDEANAQFREASGGPDKGTAERARKERAVLPKRTYADIYADAYGWARVGGPSSANPIVPTLRLRGNFRPTFELPLEIYVAAQVTRDTSSHGYRGSAVPEVYSDNYATFGAGMRFRLWQNRIALFGQIGPAINLLNDGRDRAVFDVRAGGMLYAETAKCAPAPATGEARVGLWPCFETYAEGIHVRRFDNNVIGFVRPRAGIGYLVSGPVLWQGVVEGRATKDVNDDYYNNFADAGVGHRWRLLAPFRVDLLVSANAGSYYGLSGRDPAPSRLGYADLRAVFSTYVEF
jgi:hypothetical protein